MAVPKARQVVRIDRISHDYVSAVLRTETGGEWDVALTLDASAGGLTRPELLRVAKLCFPAVKGNEWFKIDTESIRTAIITDQLPDELEGTEAAESVIPATAAPTDALAKLGEALSALGITGGGGVDEKQLRELVEDTVAVAVENIPPRVLRIQTPTTTHDIEGHAHKVLPEVIQILSAGLHVFLVGPAGSGKSTIAHQAADALGLPFYALSVGPTTPTTKFFGFQNVHGDYVRTPFREAFEHGGVMLIDELDNGHPGLIAELNQALANGYCAFADGMVKRHDDCRIVATGNTFGTGPDRIYVGRNILDFATLDRFEPLDVEYDEQLERELVMAYATDENRAQIREWLAKVRRVRAKIFDQKLARICSPRASLSGARMIAAGMDPARVAEIRLWAGMDETTRAKLDQ